MNDLDRLRDAIHTLSNLDKVVKDNPDVTCNTALQSYANLDIGTEPDVATYIFKLIQANPNITFGEFIKYLT